MIGEINQDNLYLILPSKISCLANILVEQESLSLVNAIKLIYASDLYKKLQQENTKMWHLGPVALYEEFISEH